MSEKDKRPPVPAGPGGPMAMMVEKPKDFKGTFKKLTRYLSVYKWGIFIIMILAALSTVFSIIGPKILAYATDELARGSMAVITGGTNGINFSYIGTVLLLLAGLYFISAGFSYVQGYMMAGVSAKVSYNLRSSIMKKINLMPLSYFNRVSHGEVLSRITNDVDTLNQSLNQGITQLITSVASLIGITVMMLTISWQLTLVALLILPLTMAFVLGIVKISQKFFKGQQKFLGSVNGCVEEIYSGHLVVKAFSGEAKAMKDFDIENNKLYGATWKAQFLSGLMHPVMNFVGNLGYVAICIIGAAMATVGTMTIGGILAFIQYVRNFTQPITQLANISNVFQQAIAAAERVFEFLGEEEEAEGQVKMKISQANIKGDVTFKDVKFGYGDSGSLLIKNFSADIKAGQKIAIVGPTGAGKTTIVKLIMRFHDLKGGAIYIDGYNTTDFSRHDMRSEFGMVLQDTWLFRGTILENIRYGRLDATDEQVIEAAKNAQVDQFIRTLPGGYSMELNEEATNISQGQKQLLTIARALLSDTTVMILDEATSSVDTRTEVLIQKAMDKLMEGRTSFIIAHRLSTIKNADVILCMKDGDIVEQGSHNELMEKQGFYYNLYNSQFENVA